jgi:uncharacterized protein DUF3306
MTDRDDSPKGFLERWSRKKIEGEREADDAPTEPRATDVSLPDEPGLPDRPAANTAKPPVEGAPKPEFDLASLPSLDSITAVTDIRAFLGPGVPKELARAALRRAWSADPAIRDFKGLAENDWDFTDPTAMPGFGALPEGTDIAKMLAQIFGEKEQPADPGAAASLPAGPRETHKPNEIAAPEPRAAEAPSAASEDEPTTPKIPVGEQQVFASDFVHRNNNIAMHNSTSDDELEERKDRRQHGTALPQ